jgi:hypothetical protein
MWNITGIECFADRASQYIGTVTDRASQYISIVTDRASQYIGIVTDRASQYIGTVTDRASQYIGIVTDRASQYISIVTDRASQYISIMTDRASLYVSIMKPAWFTFHSVYWESRSSTCFEHYLLILRSSCTIGFWHIACVLCQLAVPRLQFHCISLSRSSCYNVAWLIITVTWWRHVTLFH